MLRIFKRGSLSNNKIPGVIYGKQMDPISIECDYSLLENWYSKHTHYLYSVPVDLRVEEDMTHIQEQTQNKVIFVRDLHVHHVSGRIQHFDLLVLNKQDYLRVKVPLKFPDWKTLAEVKENIRYPVENVNHVRCKVLAELLQNKTQYCYLTVRCPKQGVFKLTFEDIELPEGIIIIGRKNTTISSLKLTSEARRAKTS